MAPVVDLSSDWLQGGALGLLGLAIVVGLYLALRWFQGQDKRAQAEA